jgi:2-desacetyl-2-hydroxyethyl bacteriochlorophyllide A dehydrogenase
MKRVGLQFVEPYKVSTWEESAPSPAADQVLVQTLVSAISAGTELLIYRGQWPHGVATDDTIAPLAGEFAFPLKYGYACVGQVIATGAQVDAEWLGKKVFAFNPHESHFITTPGHLVTLPASVSPEEATLLPNMETAVNLLMDGRPLIGDRVAVFGQGVVGLLTTSLLARFPLSKLVALDTYPLRRARSEAFGAETVLDPGDEGATDRLNEIFAGDGHEKGADLTYELSGNPSALNQAIAVTGFGGRVVVGSYYGSKRADIDLGGYFHRSRIRIISSQVSTLAPELTGRWSVARRLRLALEMLEQVHPAHLITHRVPITRAAEAYALLDERPYEGIQVILTYGEGDQP